MDSTTIPPAAAKTDAITDGAWLIHHAKKLCQVQQTSDFDEILTAGKCGIFLSTLSASDETVIEYEKVRVSAQASNVNMMELRTIQEILQENHLIDVSKDGSIAVIGVTTTTLLSYTSKIFAAMNPSAMQKAAVALTENVSDLPKGEQWLKEIISDTFRLGAEETSELFAKSEQIGFIDNEKLEGLGKIYFNGNIFRQQNIDKKTFHILDSLREEDVRNLNEVDAKLAKVGCLSYEEALHILGKPLLEKMQAIGMYDFSKVSNNEGSKIFLTKPAAFAKFGKPFEEDILDLAKAFVSSLYYGMNFSSSDRGRIEKLELLMQRLVDGYEIGPSTAIGNDYQLLERKRVIQIRYERDGWDKYWMKLLKKEVGELALKVLKFGTAASDAMSTTLDMGRVHSYEGPEANRTVTRKKQNKETKQDVARILNTLRN